MELRGDCVETQSEVKFSKKTIKTHTKQSILKQSQKAKK